MEELLGAVFSVKPVPRFYKQDKARVELVVRQSPASEEVKRKLRKLWRWKPLPGDNRGRYS
jgi:hypothetical protein